MAAITFDYPHQASVIFQNPTSESLFVGSLGKKGINFRPNEIVAVLGNPLLYPANPQRYNAMAEVDRLWQWIAEGRILVLSTPDQPDTAVIPDRIYKYD